MNAVLQTPKVLSLATTLMLRTTGNIYSDFREQAWRLCSDPLHVWRSQSQAASPPCPVPAATGCGLSPCKAGSDMGTWLVCKAEHPVLEEQCGNESLGIGR